MPDIKVLLADDHAMVRGAIAGSIAREPDLEVVAQAANASEALRLAVEHAPDVVLMDVDMPGPVPFDLARRIVEDCPGTRVIFLSAYFKDRYVDDAIAAGAKGYVVKTEARDVLVEAIRSVAAGGAYFSAMVRERLAPVAPAEPGAGAEAGPERTRASLLTPRELEVLRYLAQGLSKKEIAAVMGRSVKTIDNHCSNLMAKLDIHDRVELARYAIREGLSKA